MKYNYDEQKYLKALRNYDWFLVYYDKENNHYKRCYRPTCSKNIKKQCNHSVRRYKYEISNGNNYRKVSEFWYELY